MTQLHHYYHVYADGDWGQMVDNHIYALKSYGLLESLSTVNVGIVGSHENKNKVVQYMLDRGTNFNLVGHDNAGWEQVTIDPLWEHAKKEKDAYFLYCHTKGAANYAEVNEKWRRGMTRKLVVEWKNCVQKLDEGFSTVGCHYKPVSDLAQYPFWGGNFWWATGMHLSNLDKCWEDSRYWAEAWIGTKYSEPWFKPHDIWPVQIGAVCEDY